MAHFICPITQCVFTDPVICIDGHTYERSAIQDWFNRGNLNSPMTRKHIGTSMITNYTMRSQLSEAGHLLKAIPSDVPVLVDVPIIDVPIELLINVVPVRQSQWTNAPRWSLSSNPDTYYKYPDNTYFEYNVKK